MRRKPQPSEAIGTDSFLDIVANLVGILLILLMVIGARMDDASDAPSESPEPAVAVAGRSRPTPPPPLHLPEIIEPDLASAELEYQRVISSVKEAEAEAKRLEQLTQAQKLDRDNLLYAVARAEKELERRRTQLDAQQQSQVQEQVALQQAQEKYDSLLGQIESVQRELDGQKPEVLQHVATPMAKTVFVREEHFQLKNGRLLFVPLNEMTAQLRSEAPKKIWKLERARRVTETIGPRHGFQMRYTLQRARVPFQTESGIRAVRDVVELDRFEMVPVGRAPGETVEQALEPTSSFRSRIAGWDPQDTIITVWTYPDSFAEFRELKGKLFELGFLTAARPLPAHQLISGSPEGTRSAAQ